METIERQWEPETVPGDMLRISQKLFVVYAVSSRFILLTDYQGE